MKNERRRRRRGRRRRRKRRKHEEFRMEMKLNNSICNALCIMYDVKSEK
jgi:hypothetical protein